MLPESGALMGRQLLASVTFADIRPQARGALRSAAARAQHRPPSFAYVRSAGDRGVALHIAAWLLFLGAAKTSRAVAALDAGNVRKMFKRVCAEAGIGDSWTPREP